MHPERAFTDRPEARSFQGSPLEHGKLMPERGSTGAGSAESRSAREASTAMSSAVMLPENCISL